MTTPGSTSPGESGEKLESKKVTGELTSQHIRESRKFCETTIKDPVFSKEIKKFYQTAISRDTLRENFKTQLKNTSPEQKKVMGIDGESDADIESFMSRSGCFEHQFMHQIEYNAQMRGKAKNELIQGAIESSEEEYELSEEDKNTLLKTLKKQDIKTLRTFIEIPKYRRKIIKQSITSELREKKLDDIDFTSLHNKIANLPSTHPDSRKIRDAWVSIMGGIKVQDGETIESAMERVQRDGVDADLSGDFERFFACSDDLISPENKKRILSFLLRQYLPLVTYDALDAVDPASAKNLYKNEEKETKIQTGDPKRDELIKNEQETWRKKEIQASANKSLIQTRNLSFGTQLKLLSTYGSARKIEQQRSFWKGQPGSLRGQTADYREAFKKMHGMEPKKLFTQTGLTTELSGARDIKINNLEKFVPGNIMMWTQHDKQGQGMVGYYEVDTILGENPDDETVIKLRFLGNNKNPVSPTGIPRYYTGPEFFHYLHGCSENGEIDFIEGGDENLKKQVEKDGSTVYSDDEVYRELRDQFGNIDITSREALDSELDEVLFGKGNAKESDNPADRSIHEGMLLALSDGNSQDTFQIQSITEPDAATGENGKVTLWDGWGKGAKSLKEMSWRDFVNLIKKLKGTKYKSVYRVPSGGKKFDVNQFSSILKSESHNLEGRHKQNKRVTIQDGKIGQIDENSGQFSEMSVFKVGAKKDLFIESIEGDQVTLRMGTFTQMDFDKKTGKIKKQAGFKGTGSMTMHLSWLWSYMQSNTFQMDKPPEKGEKFEQEKEDKSSENFSWWNIFKHAHSMGTILHGDLWKAPWKAFEEQHHKDHAFAGKITAALAVEKAQRIPGVGKFFDYDWANLMVGDANSTFQSYLDELVGKVDGMGSFHRVRMIKKWGKNHFPDPKFMAAMFASMKIFGQLYPYNQDDKDPRNGEWHWYNSIRHGAHIHAPGFPEHMPPHPPEKWPVDEAGNPMTEIQACFAIFNKFKHPVLKNLGRRFQKYMNGGHKELIDGGVANLNQRTTMEGKLGWMLSAVVDGKPTEAFGGATSVWLSEGYPREITTMPYAALLFGRRDEQLLPLTQEHLREEFQKTTKIPMFVFAQNKNLGNVFRETGVAFAHTISSECGGKLEELIKRASPRIKGSETRKWTKDFQSFWTKYGAEIMDKMSGMRDPMLNLMVNDRPLFDELLADMPPAQQKQYEPFKKRSTYVQSYYSRMYDMQCSPEHSNIRGSDNFYGGDHFRFRKNFDSGFPTMWMDWDGYIDANLENGFVNGDGTKGDGIFNEMRGFLDAIPTLAAKMAKNMGMEGNKNYIDKISKSLYEKNIATIKPILQKRKFNNDVKAAYYNVSSMILGIADVKQLTETAAGPGKQARFQDYKQKMDEINKKAESIARTEGFAASLQYRSKMYPIFEAIVEREEETQSMSLTEIENGGASAKKKKDVATKIADILDQTESTLRTNTRSGDNSQQKNAQPDEDTQEEQEWGTDEDPITSAN